MSAQSVAIFLYIATDRDNFETDSCCDAVDKDTLRRCNVIHGVASVNRREEDRLRDGLEIRRDRFGAKRREVGRLCDGKEKG